VLDSLLEASTFESTVVDHGLATEKQLLSPFVSVTGHLTQTYLSLLKGHAPTLRVGRSPRRIRPVNFLSVWLKILDTHL